MVRVELIHPFIDHPRAPDPTVAAGGGAQLPEVEVGGGVATFASTFMEIYLRRFFCINYCIGVRSRGDRLVWRSEYSFCVRIASLS